MKVSEKQSLMEAAAGCELPTMRYLTVRVPWAYCHLQTRKDRETPQDRTELEHRAARGQKPEHQCCR